MTVWVVRAGRHGENEIYAIDHAVVTIGWEGLGDLSDLNNRDALQALVDQTYPDQKRTTTQIWTGEVWALRMRMQLGDLVVLPLKTRSALAVARITGEYKFVPDGPFDGKHQRSVQWIRTDLPRAEVDQDILYSLGSTLAVFQISRGNAEERIIALMEGRPPRDTAMVPANSQVPNQDEAPADLEQLSNDQVMSHIRRKFRGHDLARLVEGILVAQGYKVFRSAPGADGGVDLLAGLGPMGFDMPRLAVQVKSSDSPSDVSVLRELQGVMPRFGATHGLIVSLGGFKESVKS